LILVGQPCVIDPPASQDGRVQIVDVHRVGGEGPAKESVAASSSRRKPEGDDMKVVVDLSVCDLHGLCVEAAPEVFQIGDDGALHVLIETPPDGLRAKVDKAVRECPTGAISIEE